MTKTMTAKQYERVLTEARTRHDARFTTDNPPPVLSERTERATTRIEKLTGYLWLVWLFLALCGAVIAVPHTLAAVLPTVDAAGPMALLYSVFVFAGVELALVSVSLVQAMKRSAAGEQAGKQASVIGTVNALALRVGFRVPFGVDHLPDRKPGDGAALVGALFAASLIFNQVDALSDLPQLAQYRETLALVSRLVVGALGPGLLIVAGHRFAESVVQAAAGRESAAGEYQRNMSAWETRKDASWSSSAERFIQQVKTERGFDQEHAAPTRQVDQEHAAPDPLPVMAGAGSNGHNGHHGLS